MAGLVLTVVAVFLFTVTVVNVATTAKGMLIYLKFIEPGAHKTKGHPPGLSTY